MGKLIKCGEKANLAKDKGKCPRFKHATTPKSCSTFTMFFVSLSQCSNPFLTQQECSHLSLYIKFNTRNLKYIYKRVI